MTARHYRVLFAENEDKLKALTELPRYRNWTFFSTPLPFTRLEADRNFKLALADKDALDIQGPGVFTVGFAP